MAIKTYKKGSTEKLSENFHVYEFDCNGERCCSTTLIDEQLVKYLQQIRDHFGKPVIISSAYRCAVHNAQVPNAAKKSKHIEGMAADITIDGVRPAEIAKYAESIGVLGIGLYEKADCGRDFVHIDTRTAKGFWYGDAQAYRSTFGGSYTYYKPTIIEWQKAAMLDGFVSPKYFAKYGADGKWGSECEAVAKVAIVKERTTYEYRNLTKLVQKAIGVDADGLCGKETGDAIAAWQARSGLTSDRKFGVNSWKKLLGIS